MERCVKFGSKLIRLLALSRILGRNGPYARSNWRACPAPPRSFLKHATTSSGRVGEAQSPHPDIAIKCPSGLWMSRRQTGGWPETGFGEINGDVRERDFWLEITSGWLVTRPESAKLPTSNSQAVLGGVEMSNYHPKRSLNSRVRSRATVKSVSLPSFRRTFSAPPGSDAISLIHFTLTIVLRWMRRNFFGSSFFSSSMIA